MISGKYVRVVTGFKVTHLYPMKSPINTYVYDINSKRMNFYNHHIESNTISLTFELRGSLGIPRQARSALKFFALGAGLGIPSEPRSSKVRLIVLLSI